MTNNNNNTYGAPEDIDKVIMIDKKNDNLRLDTYTEPCIIRPIIP